MISFLLALQFLTIIPVKINHIDERKISKSIIYFPLVGLLLGVALVGVNNLVCTLNFQELSINIILVISLVILTGGIHLDGLSDSFDALLSRKSKEEMLEIMRDSHAGVMGFLSIISIILLKIAFLYSIDLSLKPTSLLLMCTSSRWSMVLLMFLFPYARREGKAKVFIQGVNFKIFILSTIIALPCVIIIWQLRGLIVIVTIAISVFLIGKFINNRIGGITGDIIGATNELMETISLFIIYVLGKVHL